MRCKRLIVTMAVTTMRDKEGIGVGFIMFVPSTSM